MSVAFLSAMRSKDPSTQVGACIVSPDKKIVGIGYNGFPLGCRYFYFIYNLSIRKSISLYKHLIMVQAMMTYHGKEKLRVNLIQNTHMFVTRN